MHLGISAGYKPGGNKKGHPSTGGPFFYKLTNYTAAYRRGLRGAEGALASLTSAPSAPRKPLQAQVL
jgi:hypothetical protein